MKYFVGGFGGTGSRCMVQIAQQLGLNIEEHNPWLREDSLDFGDEAFKWLWHKCYRLGDYTPLLKWTDEILINKEDFFIKHGFMMFMQDEIRSYFKDAKIIYIMRNPIDNVMSTNHLDQFKRYHGLFNPQDMISWVIKQSKIASSKADLVVRYEDLCFNTDKELSKIKEFLNIDKDIKFDLKPSSKIGIGKKYYDGYKEDLIELGFSNE